MGHGTDENTKPIYVKLTKTKPGEIPRFVYKENNEETDGDYLSGYISDMSLSEYEWPKDSGKKVQTFVIKLTDGDTSYQFEASYTSMSRAMLNCLMTVEYPGKMKFKVVPGKANTDYPSLFVTVDESDALKWHWKYEEFSKLIDGTGDNKDYTRLNTMWGSEIENTLAPHFKEAFAKLSAQGIVKADTPEPTRDSASEMNDDTPDPVLDTKKPAEGEVGHSIVREDIDVSKEMPDGAGKSEEEKGYEPPLKPEEDSDDMPF